MQKAEFSIVSYKFDQVNINSLNHKNNELSLSFDTKGLYSQSDSEYYLTFKISVFNDNQNDNPFVVVQCVGTFKFENVANINEIPDFFYRNSIAILFPYVRAYVSLITTQANVPGVILPTLNLSNLESDLRKNTTQK